MLGICKSLYVVVYVVWLVVVYVVYMVVVYIVLNDNQDNQDSQDTKTPSFLLRLRIWEKQHVLCSFSDFLDVNPKEGVLVSWLSWYIL